MKYFIASFLLFFFSSRAAFGQITITESDILNAHSHVSGTSYSSTDTVGARALENESGANQTWDFTGRPYNLDTTNTTATVEFLTYPGGAPDASDPDFTSATHVAHVSDTGGVEIWDFFRIDASGEYLLGVSGDSAGHAMKIFSYSPPMQIYAFPLTYGTTWNSRSAMNMGTSVPGLTDTISISASVDGYGTLVLPSSPSSTVLRIKKRTINTQSFGFGGYSYSRTDTSYSFDWVGTSGYGANIAADSALRPRTISYTVAGGLGVKEPFTQKDPLSLSLSQNPASSFGTRLSYVVKAAGNVKVELMDALGNSVQMLLNNECAPGLHTLPIDPGTLPAGTYFIRAETSTASAMQKLIIQ